MFRIRLNPKFIQKYNNVLFNIRDYSLSTFYIIKSISKIEYKIYIVDETIYLDDHRGTWSEEDIDEYFRIGHWIKINNYEKENSGKNPDINAGV